MKQRNQLIRLVQYFAGLEILALGGAFSIVAGQGTTPVNALPYVLSQIFESNIRFWMMLLMGIYLLFQGILLKKFHWSNIVQLLVGLLYGVFVDWNLLLVGSEVPFGVIGIILYIILSIFLVSLGITLYVDAGILQMPTEGLISAMATKYPKRWPFHRGKVFTDTILVVLAIFLGIVFLGEMRGVGIGTIVSAMLIGQMVHVFQKLLTLIRNRCSDEQMEG